MLLCYLSCRRGNDASNHVTWDFDASTMVRPTKSTEDGADSNSASSAGVASTSTTTTVAVSNQRINDQDSLTPTESNHKVPFSEKGEGQGEELPPVPPQLGIDETAMVLESGNRKSIVEGAEKRNSVVLVGEDGVDGHNSVGLGHNAVGHEKVSVIEWMLRNGFQNHCDHL